MRTTRTVDPVIEPINVDEAKDHIRLDGTDDDAYVMALIVAVRERTEDRTRRALLTQTWEGVLDRFPASREIWVRHPELQSVTSVKYEDENGDTQTFADTNYYVDTANTYGRISLLDGVSWPGTENRANAVTITFKAGYGDDVNDVPQMLRQGMLILLAHWYEAREPVLFGCTTANVPESYNAIVWNYRVDGFPGNC